MGVVFEALDREIGRRVPPDGEWEESFRIRPSGY
jgi:hypothetical protein